MFVALSSTISHTNNIFFQKKSCDIVILISKSNYKTKSYIQHIYIFITVHVLKIVNTLPTFPKVGKIALIHILASLHQEYTRLLVVPVPPRIRKIYHVRQTFASFVDVAIKEGSSCSEKLRFQSINQLERLKNGFRFPTGYIRITTYKFTAEEIILISLTRLHWPLAWKNVVKEFPGRMRWELQKAFYWFLDFMIINWALPLQSQLLHQ